MSNKYGSLFDAVVRRDSRTQHAKARRFPCRRLACLQYRAQSLLTDTSHLYHALNSRAAALCRERPFIKYAFKSTLRTTCAPHDRWFAALRALHQLIPTLGGRLTTCGKFYTLEALKPQSCPPFEIYMRSDDKDTPESLVMRCKLACQTGLGKLLLALAVALFGSKTIAGVSSAAMPCMILV